MSILETSSNEQIFSLRHMSICLYLKQVIYMTTKAQRRLSGRVKHVVKLLILQYMHIYFQQGTFIVSVVKLLFFTSRHWSENFLLISLMHLLNNQVITVSFPWHSSYKETLVTQLVTRSLCNGSCSQELHYGFCSTREKASQHNYMSQMESLMPDILVQERDLMT